MVIGLTLLLWAGVGNAATMGTAFTFQGRLLDMNEPAAGMYDLRCRLFDAKGTGATQVGPTLTFEDGHSEDGYFTVELDFGTGAFNGYERWLELAFRPAEETDEEAFVVLDPRIEMTPAPYALYAGTSAADNDWAVSGIDMYAIPSGNVGIGTTTPNAKLQINRGATGNLLIGRRDDTGTEVKLWFHQPTGKAAVQVTGGGNELLLNPDVGNVGIGTTTADAKLKIETDSEQYGLYVDSSVSSGTQTGVYGYVDGSTSSDSFGVRGASANPLGLNIGVQGWARQPSTGDNIGVYGIASNDGSGDAFAGYFTWAKSYFEKEVGIGTESPGTLLHVYGGDGGGSAPLTGFDMAAIENTGNAYFNCIGSTNGTVGVLFSDDVRARGGVTYSHSDDALHFYSSSGIRMVLNSTGLGLDTWPSYASAKLDVRGDQVRIWNGSTSIDSVSGAGDLYVGRNLEADGNIYMIQVYNTTNPTGRAVYVQSNGRLGFLSSSARYKENIVPLHDNFSKILDTQPVSFNSRETKERGIGLVAEELDRLGLKNLVIYDEQGRPDSVRYEWISLYLLEVIKAQEESMGNLRAENESLKARLQTENELLQDRIASLERAMKEITSAKGTRL